MLDARHPERRGLSYEARLTVWALLGGAPALLVALWFVWRHLRLPGVQLALTVVLVAAWGLSALVLRDRVTRPLQTLSNLIAALQERDYSIRARGGRRDSPLGLAFLEVNLLADTLRRQRL